MDPSVSNQALRLYNPAGNREDNLNLAKMKFKVGQVIEAQVISKDSDLYLLSYGEKQFLAEAENQLQTGQKVLLEVLGSKDDIVFLKRTDDSKKASWDNKDADSLRQLIGKYGLTTEKDIRQIESMMKHLPCDQASAVRYLLDPHVIAAVLFPLANQELTYQKIEVDCYKSSAGGQEIFEILLELELERLGHIEISVKSVEGNIYTRIWSQSEKTWQLLDDSMDRLRGVCKNVELVSFSQGSLIRRNMHKKVDIIV